MSECIYVFLRSDRDIEKVGNVIFFCQEKCQD